LTAEFLSVNGIIRFKDFWPAYGYKFHTPDRTIAISGDTAPFNDYLRIYQGSDILVHEAYSSKGLEHRSSGWQRYHSSVHTSSRELEDMASKAKPGLLILYHQLYHGVSDEDLLSEIEESYNGKVVSGKDLDIY